MRGPVSKNTSVAGTSASSAMRVAPRLLAGGEEALEQEAVGR